MTFGLKDNELPVDTIKSPTSKYRMKKVQMNLQAEVGERLELLTSWVDLLRSDHRYGYITTFTNIPIVPNKFVQL